MCDLFYKGVCLEDRTRHSGILGQEMSCHSLGFGSRDFKSRETVCALDGICLAWISRNLLTKREIANLTGLDCIWNSSKL